MCIRVFTHSWVAAAELSTGLRGKGGAGQDGWSALRGCTRMQRFRRQQARPQKQVGSQGRGLLPCSWPGADGRKPQTRSTRVPGSVSVVDVIKDHSLLSHFHVGMHPASPPPWERTASYLIGESSGRNSMLNSFLSPRGSPFSARVPFAPLYY